jgi:hypothetical protein
VNVEEIPPQWKVGENPQQGLTQHHECCDVEDLTRGQMVELEFIVKQQPPEEDACRQAQALSWKAETEITSPASNEGAQRSSGMQASQDMWR